MTRDVLVTISGNRLISSLARVSPSIPGISISRNATSKTFSSARESASAALLTNDFLSYG